MNQERWATRGERGEGRDELCLESEASSQVRARYEEAKLAVEELLQGALTLHKNLEYRRLSSSKPVV